MPEAKERAVVNVVIVGHEAKKTTLKIDEWSKYPVPIYGISGEDQGTLPIGAAMRLVLQFDRLKEGKDPERPYNWFLSFVGIAAGADSEGVPFEEPADDEGSAAPSRRLPAEAMDRDTNIRRQVALKAAVDFAMSRPNATSTATVERVLEVAREFVEWLEGA